MVIQIRKVLVPVDFSDCCRVALDYAIHFGNHLGVTTIDVLHVWKPPRFIDPETKLQVAGGKDETLGEFVKSKAGQAMKDFLEQVESGGKFEVHGRLESGDPHLTIVEVSDAETYDMIIMGTQGETRTTRLGSTAQKVVRDASCPVLTIRTPPADAAG